MAEDVGAKAGGKPRVRDLGVVLEGVPGALDAITDVAGIEVGFATLVSGEGTLAVGQGPVRTGVTAILPRGKASKDPVFAGWFPLNGNGEMTGTVWIDESGFLEGPILSTNTHSVGIVRDAVVAWQARNDLLFQPYSYPVVAETYDGWLNDINGFHVRPEHAVAALEGARGGAVAEGNVGGGTGMVCFGFKGGTGTASRLARVGEDTYTVGVLVQANFGLRHQLTVAGVPVGKAIPKIPGTTLGSGEALAPGASSAAMTAPGSEAAAGPFVREQGSIIVVVATDAPLLPHQLKRLARRAALGLGRTGGAAGNGSGDIMIAFSTANAGAAAGAGAANGVASIQALANVHTTPLFDATIFATEEAILNALVAAETMTGIENRVVEAISHDRLRAVMRDAIGGRVDLGTSSPHP